MSGYQILLLMAICLIGGFVAAWEVQEWRWGSKEAKDIGLAFKQYQDNQDNINKADTAGQKAQQGLQAKEVKLKEDLSHEKPTITCKHTGIERRVFHNASLSPANLSSR
jgi:hypothetical protein